LSVITLRCALIVAWVGVRELRGSTAHDAPKSAPARTIHVRRCLRVIDDPMTHVREGRDRHVHHWANWTLQRPLRQILGALARPRRRWAHQRGNNMLVMLTHACARSVCRRVTSPQLVVAAMFSVGLACTNGWRANRNALCVGHLSRRKVCAVFSTTFDPIKQHRYRAGIPKQEIFLVFSGKLSVTCTSYSKCEES